MFQLRYPHHSTVSTLSPFGESQNYIIMAKKYIHHTLEEYVDALSQKTPVPGGGSAAALTASVAAALLSMVANYSIGKSSSKAAGKRIEGVLHKSEHLRKQFLELVDLDAQAYLRVVQSRGVALKERRMALKEARKVPLKVCRLCYQAVRLTPILVEEGNKHLLSDVEVAVELLEAAFNAALINVRINQG